MDHCNADPRARFTSRVDAYTQARPRYPRGVIDHLVRTIGFNASWQVVDVGSGTGISTALFLAHGNPVIAVEPNAAMRKAAEQALCGFAGFRSVDGAAETTTLPDAFCDLIVCAQAFHWFDIVASRAEFLRILRPGGYALLMWNDRKLTGTPFLEEYERLLIEFGTDYLQVRHNNIDDARLSAFFGEAGYETVTFPNAQRLDYADLEARLRSSSYTPAAGDERYAPMMSRLRAVFDRRQESGHVTIEYDTTLFLGPLTRLSRSSHP